MKNVNEKAKSIKQQQLFGIVHAIQTGQIKKGEASPEAKKMARGIKKKEVEKFAKTKHKNLPIRVPKKKKKAAARSKVNEMCNRWEEFIDDLEV